MDKDALRKLEQRSQETGSDAVVVYYDGNKVFEYPSKDKSEPIYTMSCTKSITGLAVMEAITEGKIKSIDEPVYDFFPELKQGRKKLITIRTLLSMTSGLSSVIEDNYGGPDSVKLAIASEQEAAPGAKFAYNNRAVNLLAGVIQIATGEQMDAYVDEHFFYPMGIVDWRWERDTVGNPYAMSDLKLLPEDFAKFGLLILQKGQWQGKQLLAANWIDELKRQSQPYQPLYSLLWWRIPTEATGTLTSEHFPALAAGGLDPALIAKLRKLQGMTFHGTAEWHRALASVMPDWEEKLMDQAPPSLSDLTSLYVEPLLTWKYRGFDGIEAAGQGGQYLVIFPERKLVAVRMRKPHEDDSFMKNRFEDFPDLVRALAPVSAANAVPAAGK